MREAFSLPALEEMRLLNYQHHNSVISLGHDDAKLWHHIATQHQDTIVLWLHVILMLKELPSCLVKGEGHQFLG